MRMPSTHFRNPKLEMRSLWRQRRRTIGRKKQSEGKMAMIVGGRRMGKRSYESSSSSSDLQEGPEKSLCLFMSGWGCPQLEGPMLYSVDLDGKSYKRRKLCRRCCREILGEPGPEPELDFDERLRLRRSSGGFRELTPLISTSSWPPGGSMVVALGSAVYVLGGCISNTATDIGWLLSPEVSYFETKSPEKGWIPVPDMLNCRDKGAVVAVEGKIYVFGGNELDNAREPWAEVFDPIKNKWKPLCRPPKSLRNSNYTALNAVAYGEENKKILIGCMFVYDVNSNTWEILPAKDEGLAFVRRSYNNLVGVGNSLYWTRFGMIHVFNMKTRRYYVSKIEGIGNQICKGYDPPPERLLHLGGKEFCLLTLDEIEGRRKRTKIRCYKFKVSKQGTKKDPGSFMASLVCRDGYIVDWPLDFRNDHGLVLKQGFEVSRFILQILIERSLQKKTIDFKCPIPQAQREREREYPRGFIERDVGGNSREALHCKQTQSEKERERERRICVKERHLGKKETTRDNRYLIWARYLSNVAIYGWSMRACHHCPCLVHFHVSQFWLCLALLIHC